MKTKVNRKTVDLSAYPNLIVVYLGMHVNRLTGIKRLLGIGPQIARSAAEHPDGLLAHENVFYSLRHIGMRQYWRDFESLEAWTRSQPHRTWWQNFLRDSGGTGFWHETYTMKGGMEAIYDDIPLPLGFSSFAPVKDAHGPMFSSRRRLQLEGKEPEVAPPFVEENV